MDNEHQIIIDEIVKLLRGGSAHIGLKDAVEGLPEDARGDKPAQLPYSIWQLVEHIRIAQWDMFQFCLDSNHGSPKWPEEYWPKETAPENEAAWNDTIKQINSDRAEFIGLLKSKNIYDILPQGAR